jgi:hypothetical protein|tara:strand:- start:10801 stop:11472 length:672 start_codon:yes stop_codon:yes gene_type:complete
MNHFNPINFDFDQEQIYNDLVNMDIFDKSFLATVIYNNGRSKYDQDGFFNKYNDVVHYNENKEIVNGKFNTFVTYNFTHLPGIEETNNNSFIDTPEGRRPIWQVYDTAWEWKKDTPKSLKAVVEQLNLKYISCVRLVGQTPPSKGIVHVDSGIKDNLKYYRNGGVSITLNVSDGGGNLQFKSPAGLETVDESKHKAWHFNDALPHCTTEITSPRIQVRVFGKQ